MIAIRRILFPTDYSDHARPAFELACALARDYGAELVVCHVSPPPVVGVADGIAVEIPTGTAQSLEEHLKAVRPEDSRIPVTHRLLRGAAAAEILRAAAELRADLIVLGTHGRSGLSRVLLGSVAEDVIRKAPCPVLTVRPPLATPVVAATPDHQAIGLGTAAQVPVF